MPAILLALGQIVSLLRVASGIAGAIATTAIVLAAFGAFVGAFVGLRTFLMQLLDQFGGRMACLAAQLGALTDLQTMFGMIAAALAVRFSRVLALRAIAMAQALSARNSG